MLVLRTLFHLTVCEKLECKQECLEYLNNAGYVPAWILADGKHSVSDIIQRPKGWERDNTRQQAVHVKNSYQGYQQQTQKQTYLLICTPLLWILKKKMIKKNALLTPSLHQPVTSLDWELHPYVPENGIFHGPITTLLSALCIWIKVLSPAHAKALMISSLALSLVIFRVTCWQAWQWKG